MKWTPALLIVYVNILLYAVCYQLQRPIEPFLVDKLSSKSTDSKQAYGQLQSFFSTAPLPITRARNPSLRGAGPHIQL